MLFYFKNILENPFKIYATETMGGAWSEPAFPKGIPGVPWDPLGSPGGSPGAPGGLPQNPPGVPIIWPGVTG